MHLSFLKIVSWIHKICEDNRVSITQKTNFSTVARTAGAAIFMSCDGSWTSWTREDFSADSSSAHRNPYYSTGVRLCNVSTLRGKWHGNSHVVSVVSSSLVECLLRPDLLPVHWFSIGHILQIFDEMLLLDKHSGRRITCLLLPRRTLRD